LDGIVEAVMGLDNRPSKTAFQSAADGQWRQMQANGSPISFTPLQVGLCTASRAERVKASALPSSNSAAVSRQRT